MNLKDLLGDTGYQVKTNIELALYKLAEDLGVPKEDILGGIYDREFNEAMLKIYKQFKKLMEIDQ